MEGALKHPRDGDEGLEEEAQTAVRDRIGAILTWQLEGCGLLSRD